MAELADALDLGSSGATCGGSSPPSRTDLGVTVIEDLKITITKPKSWQRVLEIEVPADKVDERVSSTYKKYRQEAVLPGFRKGKAPISLIKSKFSDAIEKTVLEELIPLAWEEARHREHIAPISEPVVSEVKFKPGQPLQFKATVEIRPEIQLPEHLDFTADKREVQISDADVQQALETLRDQHATVAPSEGPVGEKDLVIVDTWRVDRSGVPIVGQKTTGHPIDLSSPRVIPEYRQALVGAAIGDQKRVTLTFPEDHPQKELAGQENSFLIQVKEIKNKTLPPLEDEFARAISDYPNLRALKDGIRKKLQEQGEERVRREIENQIIDQIIDKSPFEVPESMVAWYVEALISDLQSNQQKDEDREQLRNSFRPLATRQVKRWFILQEVQKKEGIRVDEKELDAAVAALAKAQGIEPEKLRQQLANSGQLEKLRHNMEEEKTLSFLVGKAHTKTVKLEKKE